MTEKQSVFDQQTPLKGHASGTAVEAMLGDTFAPKEAANREAGQVPPVHQARAEMQQGSSPGDKVSPPVAVKEKPTFEATRFVKDGEFRTLTWPQGWRGSGPIKDDESGAQWHVAKPADTATDPTAAMALIRAPEKLEIDSPGVKNLRKYLLSGAQGADPETIAGLKNVMGRFGDNQFTNPGQSQYELSAMSTDLINGKPVLTAAFHDAKSPTLNFNVMFAPDFSTNASGKPEVQMQMLVLRTTDAVDANPSQGPHYDDFRKTIDNIWWKDRWPKEDSKKTTLY